MSKSAKTCVCTSQYSIGPSSYTAFEADQANTVSRLGAAQCFAGELPADGADDDDERLRRTADSNIFENGLPAPRTASLTTEAAGSAQELLIFSNPIGMTKPHRARTEYWGKKRRKEKKRSTARGRKKVVSHTRKQKRGRSGVDPSSRRLDSSHQHTPTSAEESGEERKRERTNERGGEQRREAEREAPPNTIREAPPLNFEYLKSSCFRRSNGKYNYQLLYELAKVAKTTNAPERCELLRGK